MPRLQTHRWMHHQEKLSCDIRYEQKIVQEEASTWCLMQGFIYRSVQCTPTSIRQTMQFGTNRCVLLFCMLVPDWYGSVDCMVHWYCTSMVDYWYWHQTKIQNLILMKFIWFSFVYMRSWEGLKRKYIISYFPLCWKKSACLWSN